MKAFMIPQYVEDAPWEVETSCGTTIVPSDLVGDNPTKEDFKDYVEGEVYEFTRLPKGIICRLSAPGYLDSTEWGYESDLASAKKIIEEFYEIDPDTGEPWNEEE